MGFVYILQSQKNGRYYIGSTVDLEKRLEQHQKGYVKATKNIRPLQLVFSQKFNELQEARAVEYRLKRLKNRKITKQIIEDGVIRLKL